MHGQAVVILVDSGSSSSFLVASVATKLPSLLQVPLSATVKIANGQLLRCTSAIVGCTFSLGDYSFQHDLRILPLDFYDIILGMDWLESYSPMQVHWQQRWLSIKYHGHTVVLLGILPVETSDLVIQLLSVEAQDPSPTQLEFSPEIEALLHEFQSVFTIHTELPLEWACDHAVPLIPGATPINVRAYRYPPKLKDEIEKQVQEMLSHGIIRPSSSPFSSPVLLVQKKDGSWQFCVDYHYLNAMTVKSAYPIPMFDQLVDELGKAKWFSILDLYSGYHQIHLRPGKNSRWPSLHMPATLSLEWWQSV